MPHAPCTFRHCDYDVEEPCPHCNANILVRVDYSLPHLEMDCPECGHKMMLCSLCNDDCDWNAGTCHMDIAQKEKEESHYA